MAKAKKFHPYYNYTKLFSFNGTYNFLVGGRGLGKTYGAVKKGIKDYIRHGHEFVYLRRYKSELVAAKMSFFIAVQSEFPDHDFRVNGNKGQIAHKSTRGDKREWHDICYFVALSTAQSQKSVNYTNVRLIIFDEFILETSNQNYLREEATVFNNFYSTVDRWQDKTRVLFLANSVSIANPYFLEYDIVPDKEDNGEFITRANGFIVCHFPNAKEFQESVYATQFGQFIQQTDYAKYSVGNEFADNNDRLIERKGSKAFFMYALETRVSTFSVWNDPIANRYYIQESVPKNADVYTLVPENVEEDKPLLMPTDPPIKSLRTAFRHARAYFDKPNTRNAFIEIFRR